MWQTVLKPECGERGQLWELGSGPVSRVTPSQLLSLGTSLRDRRAVGEGLGGWGGATPHPLHRKQDMGEAVTSYPSPLSL
jgi:hypothetical protein